jgi:predicted ester cyclase
VTQELIRRFYEDVLVGGHVDALDEIATADYQEHDPLPGQGDGLEGLKDRVTMLKVGLAVRFTIEDVIHTGHKLVVRWTDSGTPCRGIPRHPRDKQELLRCGNRHLSVEDGKLAEHWHVIDQLAMLQQLGLIHASEATDA